MPSRNRTQHTMGLDGKGRTPIYHVINPTFYPITLDNGEYVFTVKAKSDYWLDEAGYEVLKKTFGLDAMVKSGLKFEREFIDGTNTTADGRTINHNIKNVEGGN